MNREQQTLSEAITVNMRFCHHLYLHIVLIFMNTKHIEDVNFHYLKAY